MDNPLICPSCGGHSLEIFHEVNAVPVNSCILVDTPAEARAYPTGDIKLGFCEDCGFICNAAFDKNLTEYSGRYEETQGFSPTFNAFHTELANSLIERHDLHGKEIIEIGCGKGEFLNLICEAGGNRGVGFDPGYIEGRNPGAAGTQVNVVKDFYSEKYAAYRGDFVCCKMTLEHIAATNDFVTVVRRATGDAGGTTLFFQVPEATRIFRECAFEDIYYEHCSYFSPGSLARLFRRCGFSVTYISTEYDDQYLTLEARPANGLDPGVFPIEKDLDALRSYVRRFPEKYGEMRSMWDRKLNDSKAAGHKTVLWGSGSKAVSFLTTSREQDAIEYVVDINTYRQGHFMPGTGQAIVGPDFLREFNPDTVIVMNRIYCPEITDTLRRMDLHPTVTAL